MGVLDRFLGNSGDSETGETELEARMAEIRQFNTEFEDEIGSEMVREFTRDIDTITSPGEYFLPEMRRQNPLNSGEEKLEQYRDAGFVDTETVGETELYSLTERGEFAAEHNSEIIEEIDEIDELVGIDDEIVSLMGSTEELYDPEPGYDGGEEEIGECGRVVEKKIGKGGRAEKKLTEKGRKDRERINNWENSYMRELIQEQSGVDPDIVERLNACRTANSRTDEATVAAEINSAIETHLDQIENQNSGEMEGSLGELVEAYRIYFEMISEKELTQVNSQNRFMQEFFYGLEGLESVYEAINSGETERYDEKLEMVLDESRELYRKVNDVHQRIYQQ